MPLRREHARIALATIRLVNGALALLAPGVMLRRLGADPRTHGVAVYPLRMFGIRTVVLGVELLAGGSVQHKGKVGVIIHAADAASAITATARAGRRRGSRDLGHQHRPCPDHRQGRHERGK